MPRTERKASKTGIYHVMMRGINKQLIFEEKKDYLHFLDCLSEVKKISGFKLFAYCLMDNHLHLLLKTEKEPMSQIFKRIGARYVFWFNWKYGRSGHLFQDRFRSEPIESDDYFIMALLYIYQNPVAAGLCKRPDEYKWSSRNTLGGCELIDEKELSDIVAIDTIIEREKQEVNCDFLEPKVGRKMMISDDEALKEMKSIGGIKSVSEFQTLDRATQAQILRRLREKGVSIRQLSRLSGLGKGVVERLDKA